MEAILNLPMLADQLEQHSRIGLSRGQTGDAIDVDLGAVSWFGDPATQHKHLSHLGPLAGQELMEFGGSDQFPLFEPSMSFLDRGHLAPIPTIQRWLAEKQAQVLMQGGLI